MSLKKPNRPMNMTRPARLIWLLDILRNANPARVEPHDDDMRRVAHWAWSNGLAHRQFTGGLLTYSISAKGQEMLAAEIGGKADGN